MALTCWTNMGREDETRRMVEKLLSELNGAPTMEVCLFV